MTCEQFLARHSDYLDDELTGDDGLAMALHMAGCERCARYDRVLRRGLALFREAEPIQPTLDPYIALQRSLARQEAPFTSRTPAVATAVAAAVIGIFAWSALGHIGNGPEATADGRSIERVPAESMSLWADPVAGMDMIAPRLSGGWLVRSAAPRGLSSRVLPVLAQPTALERGPYTPLVLQPPDYGQDFPSVSLLAPYGR